MRRILTVTAIGLTALACGGAPEIRTGSWGGTNVSLQVTASGGSVKFACASGSIDQALTANDAGQFDATGTYVFQGGPVPVGGFPVQAARYSGVVIGDAMTLTVAANGTTSGPFALTFGATPHYTQVCAL